MFLRTVLSAEDKRQRECLLTKFDGLLKGNKEARYYKERMLGLKTGNFPDDFYKKRFLITSPFL